MKKLILSLSLVLASQSFASEAERPFDARKNEHETMLITWVAVDNVQKVCQDEYKSRGYGGFNYKVDACSFWKGKVCTIYTKKNPTMHDVGHEIRHCYQGNWH